MHEIQHVGLVGPYPPLRGGIAQFNAKLTQTLSFKTQVSQVGLSKVYPEWLFPGSTQYETYEDQTYIQPAVSVNPYSILQWPTYKNQIRDLGLDALVIHWWHPAYALFYSSFIPNLPNTARATICHNLAPHEHFPAGKVLSRNFLQKSDLLVVHSQSDYEQAMKEYPYMQILKLFHPVYDQYVTFDLGQEKARQTLGYKPEDKVILFFGLIRPYKGLEDLLTLVPQLEKNCHVLVAGECYGECQFLQETLKQYSNVHWSNGFVRDSLVWLYFRAADLVVLPYRSASQSGVAQIALAFKKPMVLTNTGGLSELVIEGVTGYLAQPNNPASLKQAITSALRLPLDQRFYTSTDVLAKQFSWASYTSQLLEALKLAG